MRRRVPIALLLFFVFTTFTLLEMWLLFTLARYTSIPFTVGVVLLSAVLGAVMAKREGVAVVARAKGELAQGRFPAGPLADGIMLLIGGALLITPGLITDVIGFTTLVGACRKVYSRVLIRIGKRLFVPVGLGGGAAGPRVAFHQWQSGGPSGGFQGYGGAQQTYEPPPGSYRTEVEPESETPRKEKEGGSEYVDVEFRRVD